jgi:hypothetical protein
MDLNIILLLNHYKEVIKHKFLVFKYIFDINIALFKRAICHDLSKFSNREAIIFASMTPRLKGSTYGSDEYKSFLEKLGPALEHHYSNNTHHPEHYNGDIKSMSLIDLIEMLCDWRASSKRHKDGDIHKSIDIGQKRFNYSDELKMVFKNSLKGSSK